MAVIAPVITKVGKQDGSTLLVTWTPVTEADSCGAISLPEYSDKSVQVAGTFGGTSIAVQGSNDGTNFASLNDPTQTVIAITAAKVQAVLENTVVIQPVRTGGSSTSVTISILFHLTNPLRT